MKSRTTRDIAGNKRSQMLIIRLFLKFSDYYLNTNKSDKEAIDGSRQLSKGH